MDGTIDDQARAQLTMPTVANYHGPDNGAHGQVNLSGRVKGTDKWNDMIVEVCKANGGVNPIFVKCIMAQESGGEPGGGVNGEGYVGIMQVNWNNWKQDPRLQGESDSDVRFQIECGVKELIGKFNDPFGRWRKEGVVNGHFRYHDLKNMPASKDWEIFNTAWFYYGYTPNTDSKTYPLQIKQLYEGLGHNIADPFYMDVTGGNPVSATPGSGSSSGGSTDSGAPTDPDEWEGGIEWQLQAGHYDGDVFDGLNGITSKPHIIPPHYYDDDYSQIPYRTMGGDYFLRIGDSRFLIPPTQIRVSEENDTTTWNVLRQRQSMKSQSGNKTRYIDMTLYFPDLAQINGYAMDGPDGQTYYMDGLRSLIAQMKVMPFLPVENEFLNYAYDIYAVALASVNIETVPGFPNMVRANLSLVEYDTTIFLNKPSWMYDRHFMWPLFRWYYQRQLVGPSGNDREFSKNNMAWFTGDSDFQFWYIDENALMGFQDTVYENNKKMLKEGQRGISWFDFRGNKPKDGESDNFLFSPYTFPNTLIPISVTASTGNQLAPFTPQFLGKPTFQYFGSQDTRINVVFQTTSRADIESLVQLKDRIDRYNREYRDQFVGGFLRVENSFINMLGVGSVMIESMVVQTVEDSPGLFYVAMNLVSYEETQVENEQLHVISGIDPKKTGVQNMEGFSIEVAINNVAHPTRVERMMDALELYPDLHLPSYNTANKAITKINDWRASHHLPVLPITQVQGLKTAAYVDPDFYFCYPDLEDLIAAIEEANANPKIREYAALIDETLEDGEELDIPDIKDLFGPKVKEQLKEYDPKGNYKFDSLYEAYHMDDPIKLKQMTDAVTDYVRDPASYVKNFWMKAWQPDGGSYKKPDYTKVKIRSKEPQPIYFHRARAQESTDLLTSEEQYKAMLHDMVKYDRRGTMLRAFPTFVFLIIDEGKWVNINKLWDVYYTYHSVSEINVQMSRNNPVHTAYVKLSNVYGSLNYTTKYGFKPYKDEYGFTDILSSVYRSMFHEVSQKQLDERTRVYEQAQLLAGARIHIRLGYGAAASQLPSVFNGIVADIDTSDVVTLVAQSFGSELANPIMADPGETNSMFNVGKEPTDMFRYYMVQRKSNWTFYVREKGDPGDYQSSYGIEHFGFLTRLKEGSGAFQGDGDGGVVSWLPDWLKYIFRQAATSTDAEIGVEDYDTMKNIYSTLGQFKYGEKDDLEDPKAMAKESVLGNDNSTTNKYRKESRNISKYDVTADSWINAWKDLIEKVGIDTTPSYVDSVKTEDDIESVTAVMHYYPYEIRKKLKTAIFAAAANLEDSWMKDKYVGSDGKPDATEIGKKIDDLTKNMQVGTDSSDVKATLRMIINEWVAAYIAAKAITDKVNDGKKQQDSLTGEQNTKMILEGKTPWDVFRTIERVTPEYVVYPHIHQFHYTLFFGKPWWDVQYGYHLPPLKEDAQPDDYGDRLEHYVELKKPFSQFHIYSSLSDILSNGIRAVGTNLITAATPVYKIGTGNATYDVVWADYKIRASFQKNKVIDTTLVQNAPVIPDWMERLAIWTKNQFDFTSDYQKQSVIFSQNVIAESFKGMYEGELVVIGDPSVKPYDTMYISDEYSKMYGNAEVGSVTHMMSLETGFVTTIRPDLVTIVNPDPFEFSSDWEQNPTNTSGKLLVLGNSAAFTGAFVTGFYATHRRLVALQKYQTVRKGVALLKTGALMTGNIFREGKNIIRGLTTLKDVIQATRTAELGLAAAAPETGGLSLALSFIIFVSTEMLFTALKKIFVQKFNNSIKILPLFYKGAPYVAGINGHMQLIPGWIDDGNGRPYRADDYQAVEKHDPKSASSQATGDNPYTSVDEGANVTPNTGGTQDGSVTGVITAPGQGSGGTGVITGIAPAEFVKNMPADAPKPYFSWPISAASMAEVNQRVTSPAFKDRGDEIHKGTDIAPSGANRDIRALANGKVVYAGTASGFGLCIILLHTIPQTNGKNFVFYSLYGHMRQMNVQFGQEVKAGQVIAPMSNNGFSVGNNSDGTHLHVEIAMPKTNNPLMSGQPLDFKNYYFIGRTKRGVEGTNVKYEDTMGFLAGVNNANQSMIMLGQYKG